MGLAIAGIAAGVLGAGATAYSASQKGAGQIDPRSAAKLTLSGYHNQAPEQFALNQLYQPAYLGLGGQNLQQILYGTAASQGRVPHYDSHGRQIGWDTQDYAASPGLLQTIGQAAPDIQRLSDEAARAGRASDLAALNEFLPGARAAYESASPELAALRNSLSYRAQQGLNAGGSLLPEDRYRITRDARMNFAGRGLAGTDPAALAEAVNLYTGGEAARRGRQQFGLQTADILGRTQPDYASFILNQRGTFPLSMSLATSQQPLAYQRWFDPYNPTAGSIATAGAQIASQNQARQQDLYAGLGAGLLNTSGSLLRYQGQQTDPNYGTRDFSNIVDYNP